MPRIVPLRILGAVTVLLFVAMAIQAYPLAPSIPAIQLSFSEASFNAVLAQWQPSGVARFKRHFAFDFPFLVSYGLFGYLLSRHVGFTTQPSAWRQRLLPWALPFAALMDAAENLLHLSFVCAAAALPEALYFAAGVFALTKWMLVVAFAIGILCPRLRNPG